MLALVVDNDRVDDSEGGWASLPEPSSQHFALSSTASHILYHGTRGPGKTDCQLARFIANVEQGYGSFWVGVIFDRKYKNLDDLIKKSKRMFKKIFGNRCKFLESKGDYKWVWNTGEELLFRQFLKADDYWNYHGQEYPFIGWNELCKYPTSDAYDAMMSCNRSSWTYIKDCPRDKDGKRVYTPEQLPPIPLEVFSTTNPYGPGHNWVKSAFIDPAPMGEIFKQKITVFNPKTQQPIEIEIKKQAIFGSYKENPYLDPQYVAELENITDPNKRAAWLEGDWDIVAGGAIDDVWRRNLHVIPRFPIPAHWRVDRSMDWGSSHPCSVGWWAEANGEEIEMKFADGTSFTWAPPKGTLFQIAELYRTEKIGTNKGKREGSGTIAQLIQQKEMELIDQKWIEQQPLPGPADNQIRNVNDNESDTVEKKMLKNGIAWTESDKAPGSRKIGLQLIRDRLEAAMNGTNEPGLYFLSNCRASIATIPTLPRDDDNLDDVDTDAEDHAYDMVRYRVLKSANRAARKIRVVWNSIGE